MDGKSLNTKKDLKNKLREIAPQVFNEDKIDWEKLKSAFGDDINFSDERYVLNWAGKSDAFRAIQTQTTATLIPDKEESINFENTDNIFIEGENLEVLKVLQRAYYGKIKMIYIDPPYNTGNDFIYNDKFAENKNEYYKRSGEKDKEGLLTNETLYHKNTKESGHYHSNWLTMMYPRLFLARNLLRDDGVIFVSIDDNEVHNLRMLMNEIFGEENFIGCIIPITNPRGSQEPIGVSTEHEYLLSYGKSENGKQSMTGYDRDAYDKEFSFIDKNGKRARLLGLRKRGGDWKRSDRPNMYYPFYVNPKTLGVSLEKDESTKIEVYPKRPDGSEGRWTWGKETAKKNIDLLIGKKISRGSDLFYDIYRIDYLENQNGEIKKEKIKSIWNYKELNYQYARQYLKDFFGTSEIFDFPKSPFFINKLTSALDNKNGIILDFFSGSCTTAHAVLDLNKEDVGNRKFIMVQLPEKTDIKSEAYKAGYETIADIGKERIRRVIKKIEHEQKEKLNFGENKQDLGFKVFKLRESNFKIWRGDKFKSEEELEEQLLAFVNPVKEGSIEENMLYELLLKSGIDLDCRIENKNNYYLINENELVIALSKINEEIIKNIIETKPLKVITLDKLFKGNDQLKTNTTLQMKDAGIEFKVV